MSAQKPLTLSIKVIIQGDGVKKVLRFAPQTTVLEALEQIASKSNLPLSELDKKYALYYPQGNGGTGQFLLQTERFIHSYGMNDQDVVELRRFPQPIYVTDPEGTNAQLLVAYDDVAASEVLLQVCRHYNVKDPSSYILLAPGRAGGEVISLTHPLSDQIVPYGSKIVLAKKSKVSLFKKKPGRTASGMGLPGFKPAAKKAPPAAAKLASPARPAVKAPSAPGPKRGAVFGLPLQRAIAANHRASEVPNILEDCIAYLRRGALASEGLFRLSGSLLEIEGLKKRYDDGENVNLDAFMDPNIVAGVMKLYFRELPQPLLTFELYDEFLALCDRDGVRDLGQLVGAIDKLPPANKLVLRFLTTFLFEVSTHAEQNRMTVSNLALVFGPNLLRSDSVDVLRIVEDSPIINQITADIIKNCDHIFAQLQSREDGRRRGSVAAFPPGISPVEEVLCHVRVAFDYAAQAPGEMDLRVGETVAVHEQDESGWWYGSVEDRAGLFPVTFCIFEEDEEGDYYDEGEGAEYEGEGDYAEGEGGYAEGEGQYAEGEGQYAEGEGGYEGADYHHHEGYHGYDEGYSDQQYYQDEGASSHSASSPISSHASHTVQTTQDAVPDARPAFVPAQTPTAARTPTIVLAAKPTFPKVSPPVFDKVSPPANPVSVSPSNSSGSLAARPAPARPPAALLRTNSYARASQMVVPEQQEVEDTRDVSVRLAEEITKRRDLERRFLILEAALERLQARVAELESK